jgi:hypothetical protein
MTARDPNDYFPQDDLDAPRTEAGRSGKAGYVPPEVQFSEGCPKCRGTGRFTSWSGRVLGDCFACKGAGKHTFKTSPEARAKSQARASAKRVEKGQQIQIDAQAWIDANPAEARWLADAGKRNADRGGTFTFPADVLNKLWQYGSLTDGQLAAVQKLMARDVERAAERTAAKVERIETAPAVDIVGVDRLKAAFDQAAAYTAAKATGLTVRSPKITVGGITISPAKATSANPGALYVKAGETYLGKIAGGKFLASRDCTPEQSTQVVKFVDAPAEAAKVYGQETGVCCICNATLRSEWRLRGIGPICAEKFGW